ncbi:hypothetical protein ACHQM5_000959 [Ranunculus cassubicifolius]
MDNYIYPYNPLQPRDELFLQIHSKYLQHQAVPQAMNPQDPSVSKGRDKSINNTGNTSSSNSEKKLIHRDVERQRRQEMNSLYSSLRSLLPYEFVKGKRSISDHMNEASKYIKHLEMKNQELREQRDKLKRLTSSNTQIVTEGLSTGLDFVTVKRCWLGVEVIVNTSLNDGAMPLSRVLKVLHEEGLNVESCLSTSVNERLIHTLQAEIGNPAMCTDISGLQQKLMNLVRSTG